jgi:hypothetical protein
VTIGDDANDLAMAAAAIRANAGDFRALIRALSTELGDVLGDRLMTERVGKFRKSNEISALRVTLSGNSYVAEIQRDTVQCSLAHFSGGIKIRTEPMSTDVWLARLLGDLRTEAAKSDATRIALERVVIGGNQ